MNGALVIRLAGFIFVACVVSVGAGEAEKNPYLTSKVGDWVKYRMVGEGGEHKVDMIVKKTVQSVTAKEVVIEEEGGEAARDTDAGRGKNRIHL